MLTNQSVLWVDRLKAKYLNSMPFLDALIQVEVSWLWRGIHKHRKVVGKGACWAVPSCQNLSIWSSPWIPTVPSFKPTPNPTLNFPPNMFIVDFIIPSTMSWNTTMLHLLFNKSSMQQILNIHLAQRTVPNKWMCAPSPSDQFTVKTAHEL
ncbi:hypothetical protein SLA2020_263540 [Shorea laevis]